MNIKVILTISITALILSSCSEDSKCLKLGITNVIDLSKEEDFSKEWYEEYKSNIDYEHSEEFVLIHRENKKGDETIDGLGFSKENTLIYDVPMEGSNFNPRGFDFTPEFEFLLRYNGEPYTGCIIEAKTDNYNGGIYRYQLDKGLLTLVQVLKLPHVNEENWELAHKDTLVKYEMNFKDGKPHGRWFSKQWSTDSNKLVLSMDGEFKNGLRHGKWRVFDVPSYFDGDFAGHQKYERNYADGYLNGDLTELRFEKGIPCRTTKTMYMNSVVSQKTWWGSQITWNDCISDNSKDSLYLTEVKIYKYKSTDINKTITGYAANCTKECEYCFELHDWKDCKWEVRNYYTDTRYKNYSDLNFYSGKAIPINNIFIDYSNFDKDVMSKNVDSKYLLLQE
jgi:hypothetical protein